MNCKKVILLNENIIHPNCYKCGNELSPYQIEDEVSYETLELLKLSKLWLWTKNDKHTILLCTNCIRLKKDK